MDSAKEKGVPQGRRAVLVEPRMIPDWEAAHIFLQVVRCRSFRSAAERLGQSVNALRRRVQALEKSLGVTLLTRHVDGVRLTEEGAKVFAAAERMETASFDLLQARSASEKNIEGEVRLAVTEGLGTFWLAPRLVEFQRANPKLMINLTCAMRSADVMRLEADVAIQLERPKQSDLKMVKLGRMHLMFFASRSYLQAYGHPRSLEELSKHRMVVQSDDDKRWRDVYDKLFPGVSPEGLVSIRSNVSSAHYWSISKGAGIGAVPTYAYALGGDIVPVDVGEVMALDIWLTYHPDAKRIARVRRMIEMVTQSFDPRLFPWFRDEFIHPDKLLDSYKGEPLPSMFAGYQGRRQG
jgi:DNA-binding transcriptional LysR family regulator